MLPFFRKAARIWKKKQTPKKEPIVFHPLPEEDEVKRLERITEELTRTMEKTRIAEYVQYLEHPGKLLWTNFLIGVARGLGGTIGLAVVLGFFVYFVQKLIMLNLPVISDFIADFIIMIQNNYTMIR